MNGELMTKELIEEFWKMKEESSDTLRRQDLVLTDNELTLLKYIEEKFEKYKIGGRFYATRIYTSLCDELKNEMLHHEISYREGRRIKFRGKDQCILRFLAFEEDYPPEVYDEIFNCIYKLMNVSHLTVDSRKILEGALEGLVNHDWTSKNAFKKKVSEIKELMTPIVGQKSAVEQMLKCYNIFKHTHKANPYVIRIKAEDGMGVDTLVKTFASAIGRYCEISCQNLGYDPETIAGSSRIYYNSTPGELAEAIINNEVQVIIVKNVNDADEKNIARLSAFFENTFVDNYFRVCVPGNVLVICTESASGNKAPEYLFKDAYTIELTKYSEDESRQIANRIIERFNAEFCLKISFDEAAMKKIIATKLPKEIHKMLLMIFSDISFEHELTSDESVVLEKTITIKDLKMQPAFMRYHNEKKY